MKRGRFYQLEDSTCWPGVDHEFDGQISVEWMLRYAPEDLSTYQQLYAASVIAAYNELIILPLGESKKKLKMLKKELEKERSK